MAKTPISLSTKRRKRTTERRTKAPSGDLPPPQHECWKPIHGYPAYEVSDQGRVRSRKNKGPPLILKGGITSGGYRSYGLTNREGERRTELASHLVARNWLSNGSRIPGKVVTHLDGSRANDAVTNLAWRTQKENMLDKNLHGTMPRGETHWSRKLTADDVIAIRASGQPIQDLAHRYGLTFTNIWRVKTRISWAHLP